MYYAPVYDTGVYAADNTVYGDTIQLDDTHHDITGTGLGDEIYGDSGDDNIILGNGDNYVQGGAGNDFITVNGNGVNTLIGGSGNTQFNLQSIASENDIQGGQGDNVINVDAPGTGITGGPGNDTMTITAGMVTASCSARQAAT